MPASAGKKKAFGDERSALRVGRASQDPGMVQRSNRARHAASEIELSTGVPALGTPQSDTRVEKGYLDMFDFSIYPDFAIANDESLHSPPYSNGSHGTMMETNLYPLWIEDKTFEPGYSAAAESWLRAGEDTARFEGGFEMTQNQHTYHEASSAHPDPLQPVWNGQTTSLPTHGYHGFDTQTTAGLPGDEKRWFPYAAQEEQDSAQHDHSFL